MNPNNVWKKNRDFYIGVAGTVLEGVLSGSLFMLLYSVMRFLWDGQFDMSRVLALTGIIAVIFLFRILIYSYGYTKAQIGGARVSKNIRLFMGDHLKRIPLSRFTRGQTGDYINTITSDVNNYEKILTHKIGDIAKNFALSLMLIVFVMTIYFPAGLILLTADPRIVAFFPAGSEVWQREERYLCRECQQHCGVCIRYPDFPGLWRWRSEKQNRDPCHAGV